MANHPEIRTQGTRLIHRLIYRWHGIPGGSVLNSGALPGDGMAPEQVAADLRQKINAMSGAAYDGEAGQVDYGRLKGSEIYADYMDCARLLRAFDLGWLSSREQRLAFWINLYNALIVDAVIQLHVENSVTEVPGFFWRAAYAIGGLRFSAFDMEYGILRANAGHPAIPGPQFRADDPRQAHSLERLDPRVHFALVCASRSCPPIAYYQAATIDDQLDLATRAFIHGGGVVLDRDAEEVRLSRIFQWYAPDFGAGPFAIGDTRPLLEFIAPYLLDDGDRAYIRSGRPKVRFQSYDWRLNYANHRNG